MYVYAWHALCGYWGGVSPESPELSRRYRPEHTAVRPSPGILEVEPSWAWDPIGAGGVSLVAAQSQGVFFDDLHSYLASAGCDGVKVDVQAIVSVLGAQCVPPPIPARACGRCLPKSSAVAPAAPIACFLFQCSSPPADGTLLLSSQPTPPTPQARRGLRPRSAHPRRAGEVRLAALSTGVRY